MKQKILLISLFTLSLAFGACTKEGDFDELDNIGISMDNISFGMPIGNSSINAGELLGKWQNTECEVTFENDLLVINYDKVYSENITFDNSDAPKSGAHSGKGTIIPDYVKTFGGDLSIDLFKNFPTITNENLRIEGIYANLDIMLKAYVKTNDTPLKKYITNAYFDSLVINVVSEDGTTSQLYKQNDNKSITVAELQQGITVNILDSSQSVADDKVAQLFKNRPKKLHYEMKMHLQIKDDNISPSDLLQLQNGNYKQYFQNTIEIDSMNSTTTFAAHFPLRMMCNNFVYQDTIAFPIDQLKQALKTTSNKVALSSSFYLAMRFINTLPLSFTINDMLINSNNQPVTLEGKPVHLFAPNQTISAPKVIPETINSKLIYHSIDQSTTHMLVQLNKQDVDKLTEGSALVLSIAINTTEGNKAVSILKDDKLTTSLYLLSNPSDEFLKERFNYTR